MKYTDGLRLKGKPLSMDEKPPQDSIKPQRARKGVYEDLYVQRDYILVREVSDSDTDHTKKTTLSGTQSKVDVSLISKAPKYSVVVAIGKKVKNEDIKLGSKVYYINNPETSSIDTRDGTFQVIKEVNIVSIVELKI